MKNSIKRLPNIAWTDYETAQQVCAKFNESSATTETCIMPVQAFPIELDAKRWSIGIFTDSFDLVDYFRAGEDG